jgi:hypothetical protein
MIRSTRACGPGVADQCVEQRRLADARLALEHDRGRPGCAVVEQPVEDGRLLRSANNHGTAPLEPTMPRMVS